MVVNNFKNGRFIPTRSSPTGSYWEDGISTTYQLDLSTPTQSVGPTDREVHIGLGSAPKATWKHVVNYTEPFVFFTFEVNLPDFFVAYKGYYVSLILDVQGTSGQRTFKEEGWRVTIDVKDCMEEVISRAQPFLDLRPEVVTAAMEVAGYLSGGKKIVIDLATNIGLLEIREGSGFMISATVTAIISYLNIRRIQPIRDEET